MREQFCLGARKVNAKSISAITSTRKEGRQFHSQPLTHALHSHQVSINSANDHHTTFFDGKSHSLQEQ
jgi:hypothetical protein